LKKTSRSVLGAIAGVVVDAVFDSVGTGAAACLSWLAFASTAIPADVRAAKIAVRGLRKDRMAMGELLTARYKLV